MSALETIRHLGIGAFRILSPLFPLYTHPGCAYDFDTLPDCENIMKIFDNIRHFREENNIRLSFHPDQFIIISSPVPSVVKNSIAELKYQAMLCELCGADVINIHCGGTYGDKDSALQRFAVNFRRLPANVKKYLTLENDDISYTVKDIFPLCKKFGIPLVYDVHHHRCNPDGLTITEATAMSAETWRAAGREPYFHISSPREGWSSGKPRPHADYVDIKDFPLEWLDLDYDFTLDIEAKAKELALLKFMKKKRILPLLKTN